MEIHQSAVVSPQAELAEGVSIGPYCIIGEKVSIGRDTSLGPHVVIEGHTRIGEGNRIYPFVTIGFPPQDIGYKQEDTRVIVGNNNIIREYTSINRATVKQDRVTTIGNDNFIMAYTHIAHDCILGNHIILSNAATLGGHTTIGDYANLSGLVGVHQFVRIGTHAFIGGKAGVTKDIPPYMIAAGEKVRLFGPNLIGLKRSGFSGETIDGLKRAYRIIWRESRSISDGIDRVRQEVDPFPELDILIEFISKSKRGVAR
jgi:UDP-N-acetylglucosamine acyltransferase